MDLVALGGKLWLKVKAMKPQTLQLIWQGQAQPGAKSVTDQARALLACADQHPLHYARPLLAFHFAQGISEDVAADLQAMVRWPLFTCAPLILTCSQGVIVLGQILGLDFEPLVTTSAALAMQQQHLAMLAQLAVEAADDPGRGCEAEAVAEASEAERFEVLNLLPSKRVFLDVTTLLALVSEVVHGDTSVDSVDPVIQMQIEGERRQPSLPLLHRFMEGKELYVTATARLKFEQIAGVVGGPRERERAAALLQRLTEVPDEPSERAAALPRSVKIKEQHVLVFGTGASPFPPGPLCLPFSRHHDSGSLQGDNDDVQCQLCALGG